MASITYYFETAVVLLVMFTLLVAAHELGHYLFARMFNMGVEEFAIGFGKRPVFQWMRRTYTIPLLPGQVPLLTHAAGVRFDLESAGSRPAEDVVVVETAGGTVLRETTRFTIRPWPLGGFVRIKGMLPEEDGSETTIAGGFYSKPPWQRLLVLFAGPLFSVLAGIAILTPLILSVGKPDNRPVLGMLAKEGPAAKAGLKRGDLVQTIDGKPISTFYAMVAIVRDSADKALDFGILRQGAQLHVSIVPKLEEDPSPVLLANLRPSKVSKRQAKLGAGWTRAPMGGVEALGLAVSYPIDIVTGLFDVVKHPSTFKDQMGGPITITRATYDTVKEGISPVLELAALLSISVGVLNLLPVMPLDGGQMTLAFAELFRRGRRLSIQVQNVVSLCGLAFMGVLIICVFFVDISRLIDNRSPIKEPPPKKATK